MKNLIEKIKIRLGWKKVVILVVNPTSGLITKYWAHGSDQYLLRTGKWKIFIDYNNEDVVVKREELR